MFRERFAWRTREHRDRRQPRFPAGVEEAADVRLIGYSGNYEREDPMPFASDARGELAAGHALRQPAAKVIVRGHELPEFRKGGVRARHVEAEGTIGVHDVDAARLLCRSDHRAAITMKLLDRHRAALLRCGLLRHRT